MRADESLPDDVNEIEVRGLHIRKGSVAAFVAGAKALQDASLAPEQMGAVIIDMLDLVPALRALGLFDIFEIRDAALRRIVEAT